jgi:ubiquinone/menaquinone biosynthesis C-methylase UbiE
MYELFAEIIYEKTHIIDVGGNLFFWELAKAEGLPLGTITIVNIYDSKEPLPDNINWVVGDGKKLPFDDCAFDIAFSNSVIEHLYDWESQIEFANKIRRIAPNYIVQTPSKRFPVEPHYITPFIHWLPKKVQRHLLRNFTVWGWITRPSQEYCDRVLAEIRLLNREEMSKMFPEATIQKETFWGWEKSLIAVKNANKN